MLIKHVKGHINTPRHLNMSCSFATCSKSFHTMNGLTSHLQLNSHNINIESTVLNFKNIEGKY